MSVSAAKEILWSDFSEYRIAEFLSKLVLTPAGCIEHRASERAGGYGCLEMKGRTARSHRRCLAHRAMYAITWGKCPAGVVVRHTCDNTRCVNPTHLVLGTQADNIKDMVSRGRAPWQKGARA